jgi:hypothetical protein
MGYIICTVPATNASRPFASIARVRRLIMLVLTEAYILLPEADPFHKEQKIRGS